MPIQFKQTTNLDISQYPIIEINFTGIVSEEDFGDWLDQMTAVLEKEILFVSIYWSDDNLALPDGYRQQEAIWYKSNKHKFFQNCKALVRVANDEAEQQALDTPAMRKAWRVPFAVVMSHEEAQVWIKESTTTAPTDFVRDTYS